MKIYQAVRLESGFNVWVTAGGRDYSGARRLEKGQPQPLDPRFGESTPVMTTDRLMYALPSRGPIADTAIDGTDFECGYPGHGPANLAFAILMDHYEDAEKALIVHEEFQRHYIENIPQYLTRWEFTTKELQAMLDAIEERLGWEAKDQEELDRG